MCLIYGLQVLGLVFIKRHTGRFLEVLFLSFEFLIDAETNFYHIISIRENTYILFFKIYISLGQMVAIENEFRENLPMCVAALARV